MRSIREKTYWNFSGACIRRFAQNGRAQGPRPPLRPPPGEVVRAAIETSRKQAADESAVAAICALEKVTSLRAHVAEAVANQTSVQTVVVPTAASGLPDPRVLPHATVSKSRGLPAEATPPWRQETSRQRKRERSPTPPPKTKPPSKASQVSMTAEESPLGIPVGIQFRPIRSGFRSGILFGAILLGNLFGNII